MKSVLSGGDFSKSQIFKVDMYNVHMYDNEQL